MSEFIPPNRHPSSYELEIMTESFADDRVRRFGLFSPDEPSRTEIYLPDGRVVTVHKNLRVVKPGQPAQSAMAMNSR